MDNCYLLKYDIHTLNDIMEEFQDIKDDIELIAEEREKMRLFKAKQQEMHHDEENNIRIMNVL